MQHFLSFKILNAFSTSARERQCHLCLGYDRKLVLKNLIQHEVSVYHVPNHLVGTEVQI